MKDLCKKQTDMHAVIYKVGCNFRILYLYLHI